MSEATLAPDAPQSAHTIGSLDLQWPTVSDEQRAANASARQALEAESD